MQYAQDRSLIGFGALGSKPWQSKRGHLEIGNSTELKIQHAAEKKTLRNFRTGIGNNNAKSQISAITGSFTLYDCGPAQLALIVRAKVRGVEAGVADSETHATGGLAGEMIVFKDLVDTTKDVTVSANPGPATSVAVSGNAGNGTIGAVAVSGVAAGVYSAKFSSPTAFTVTGPSPATTAIGSGVVGAPFNAGGFDFTIAAGNTAFVANDAFTITVAAATEMEAGVDYIVTPYGIQLLEGSRIGERGVAVGYSRIKATVAEILAGASAEQSLHFAGLNDAQDGLPYDATLHRVSFDVIAELPLSGAEYVSYSVTFELLEDYTRVGDDLSKYYTIRQAEKVAA
jgi:hypothetical protein